MIGEQQRASIGLIEVKADMKELKGSLAGIIAMLETLTGNNGKK